MALRDGGRTIQYKRASQREVSHLKYEDVFALAHKGVQHVRKSSSSSSPSSYPTFYRW